MRVATIAFLWGFIMNLRNELEILKTKYFDLKDEINLLESNRNLSTLCNLRSKFDERFDEFFDRKELRIKYQNAWLIDEKEEIDEPNYDISGVNFEEILDDSDLKNLINFYQYYINELQDKKRDLEEI